MRIGQQITAVNQSLAVGDIIEGFYHFSTHFEEYDSVSQAAITTGKPNELDLSKK